MWPNTCHPLDRDKDYNVDVELLDVTIHLNRILLVFAPSFFLRCACTPDSQAVSNLFSQLVFCHRTAAHVSAWTFLMLTFCVTPFMVRHYHNRILSVLLQHTRYKTHEEWASRTFLKFVMFAYNLFGRLYVLLFIIQTSEQLLTEDARIRI